MKIHLYTLCWNEEVIAPHFLKHYHFVDRIVVYDNQSDDRSLDILKSASKVEVRSFDTGGKHHTGKLDQIRNQAWLESKGQADFVIVCDMDEFLYHPDLPSLLEQMKKEGGTLLKPQGYEMLGSAPPQPNDELKQLYPLGARTYSFDKCVLFDPNAIEKINYHPGSHVCEPSGKVIVFRRPGLSLLHYRHLGVDYVRRRYEACATRRSDYNRKMHLGVHYLEDKQKTLERFKSLHKHSEDVFLKQAACLDVPESFDENLRLLEKAKEEKDWLQVIEVIESILSYDPGYSDLLSDLSIALRATGRAMDAGYVLKQAVALDPKRSDLWFELGDIAAGLRSEKVAIESYQQALVLNPDFYQAHLGLANVYKSFKQPAKAARHYQRAIELESHEDAAYREWGAMAHQLKRYEVACQIYAAWLKWDAQNVYARNAYALVLKAMGKEDEAIDQFKLALQHAPESLAVLNNLGTLLHLEGRAKEGGVYFRQALVLEPNNNVLKINLANALLDLGETDEAAALNQALVDDRANGLDSKSEIASE